MAGRAIVAFEADDLGAGEVVFEAQDVVDLGAAPAVDRLVVVADATDVLEGTGGFYGRPNAFIPGRVVRTFVITGTTRSVVIR